MFVFVFALVAVRGLVAMVVVSVGVVAVIRFMMLGGGRVLRLRVEGERVVAWGRLG